MVEKTSYMIITGPDIIKEVTHEEVSFEQLGGAEVHNARSGVAHFMTPSEDDCLRLLRRLLSFLPQNNTEDPPRLQPTDDAARRDEDLLGILPEESDKPYDMLEVIRHVVDHGDVLQVHEHWAKNIITGFARMDGRAVGVIANQPAHLAGTLDIDSSTKGARFVRTCDAFNVPLLTFVDVPGFLPGTAQEYGGIIRNGAKLLYSFAEATVPKVTVITRKAYGGAYDVMCSKHIRGDVNLAWPTAELAVMGPAGAVKKIYKSELEGSMDPDTKKRILTDDYVRKFANPYIAASLGYIDDVIEPQETRPRVIGAFEMLQNKRQTMPPKKHGNIPL